MAHLITPLDKGEELAKPRQMGRARDQLEGCSQQRLSRQPIQRHTKLAHQRNLMLPTSLLTHGAIGNGVVVSAVMGLSPPMRRNATTIR